MGERHYPDITDAMVWPFTLVREHLIEDPDFLNGPDCPYSGKVKSFLQSLLSAAPAKNDAASAKTVDQIVGDIDNEGLEANIKRIFKDLQDYGANLGKGDTTEKASYFRVSTALLDKLVTMLERIYTVNRQKDFESVILKFLEDHVEPDVRTKLMDYLKGL